MMRLHSLICIILVVVFCSCALLKPDEPSPYHGLSDQAQIYSVVFDLLLGPEKYVLASQYDLESWMIQRQWPGLDSAGERRVNDSLRHQPDSLIFRVCIRQWATDGNHARYQNKSYEDKFIALYRTYKVDRSFHERMGTAFQTPFVPMDAEFEKAFRSWYSLNSRPWKVDPAWISSRYKYRPMDEKSCNDGHITLFRPRIIFSHIGFNSDSTKAVLVTEANLCAHCMRIDTWFLLKEHGDWKFHAIINSTNG